MNNLLHMQEVVVYPFYATLWQALLNRIEGIAHLGAKNTHCGDGNYGEKAESDNDKDKDRQKIGSRRLSLIKPVYSFYRDDVQHSNVKDQQNANRQKT